MSHHRQAASSPPALNLVASRISKQEEGDKSVLVPPRPFFCPKKASIQSKGEKQAPFLSLPSILAPRQRSNPPPPKKAGQATLFLFSEAFQIANWALSQKSLLPFLFALLSSAPFFAPLPRPPGINLNSRTGRNWQGGPGRKKKKVFFCK